MTYDKFSRFYDLIMGDRSDAARFLTDLIARYHPKAKTVLEIACGTGSILGRLSESYAVTGLDRSGAMLAIARKKLPHVGFIRQDMTRFRIAQRFDAIVCVFDSINHLLRPAAWRRVFHRVAGHLNDNGIFIFDVNTSGKLQRLAEAPAWEKWFGRDLAIIKVSAQRSGLFEWDVKVFEHETRQRYKLLHERIRELALPKRQILESLRRSFRQVKALDPFGFKPSDQSERLYFVGKARRC
ncbi:MAG TPA: class I SAM-dependent methyltransferase [Candidatus Binatia bacterium]|jgi:SAM-dependent methyltransferase